MKTDICLNMIVKNEAKVIRRCLDSVLPLINSWVIVDTGSTDGTQDIIRDHLRGLPGALHERPWVNFGHNRSEAIKLAAGHGDYLLFMDADDFMAFPDKYQTPPLSAGAYQIEIDDNGVTYYRKALVQASLGWRYVGVLHEFIQSDAEHTVETLAGPKIMRNFGGSGLTEEQTIAKYRAHAAIFDSALREEPGNERYMFYLAQSYRDSRQYPQALDAYVKRAEMGGWAEEVFHSKLQAAKISDNLGLDGDVVLRRYLDAFEYRPSRAEPLVELARRFRLQNRFELARMFAERACKIALPADILFVDREAYEWRALDELAVASYWTGDYRVCADICRKLLASVQLPGNQRDRVAENIRFAESKLTVSPPSTDFAGRTAIVNTSELPARTKYDACPLCASESFGHHLTADCSHHALYHPRISAQMNWMRCAGCGHVFVDGFFTSDALDLIFSKTHENQQVGFQIEAQRYVSARMISKVLPYCEHGSWLDIGFGNGSLLLTALEFGFKSIGVDLRRENVESIQKLGVTAYCEDIATLKLPEPADVISMADVLEHMPFPVESLGVVRKMLRPRGVLFLSMPNIDSPVWQSLDRINANPFWGEIEHYHNFGRERLYRLLSDNGFEPLAYGVSERYRACMEVIAKKV